MHDSDRIPAPGWRRTDGYRSGCLADRTNPVLSWAAVSDQTEDRQSAYRVTAGSWDSGWITGEGQQAQLPPGTLLPETPTAVTLCLRNRAGETSQPYTVMLLNAAVADWDAPWIGLDDAQPGAGDLPAPAAESDPSRCVRLGWTCAGWGTRGVD